MAASTLSNLAMLSTMMLPPSLLIAYTLLCSLLRFRARDALHKKISYPTRASLAKMSNDDAQYISSWLAELEFPEMYYRSLQYALFKTYAFPSMSKLLVSTQQLIAPQYSPKRYVDTVILIKEFAGNPPTSERAIKAIARMNFLHSQYINRGLITQSDLLYTLSVFITEPISYEFMAAFMYFSPFHRVAKIDAENFQWINKCEWRQLTNMEICAIGTFWKSVGDAMSIEYNVLKRFNNWKDGIDFYEDIRDWAAEYEDKCRIPAESNHKTANSTVAILLTPIPSRLKIPAFQVLCALMEDGVRTAMMYSKPPPFSYTVANAAVSIRRFLLRYFFLPRPTFLKVRIISDAPDSKTGRYFTRYWDYHPFYVKPSFWSRWGPQALLCKIQGRDVPGTKSEVYSGDGYIFEEIGPSGFKGKGLGAMRETEEKLRVERPSGCPFALKA